MKFGLGRWLLEVSNRVAVGLHSQALVHAQGSRLRGVQRIVSLGIASSVQTAIAEVDVFADEVDGPIGKCEVGSTRVGATKPIRAVLAPAVYGVVQGCGNASELVVRTVGSPPTRIPVANPSPRTAKFIPLPNNEGVGRSIGDVPVTHVGQIKEDSIIRSPISSVGTINVTPPADADVVACGGPKRSTAGEVRPIEMISSHAGFQSGSRRVRRALKSGQGREEVIQVACTAPRSQLPFIDLKIIEQRLLIDIGKHKRHPTPVFAIGHKISPARNLRDGPRGKHFVCAVVVGAGQGQLLEIVFTLAAASGFPGLLNRRQK